MSKTQKKAQRIPFLITFFGGAFLLLMLLFPYASAKDDYKEYLMQNGEAFYVEEIKMTNKEAVNISLGEYIMIQSEAANQGILRETCITSVVVIVIFGLFALLTYVMAILKKPIGIMIFDLFAMLTFKIIHFDFEDRGMIPNSSYNWGLANYLTYIIGIIIIGGAIWLLIEKRKAKKLINMERVDGACE